MTEINIKNVSLYYPLINKFDRNLKSSFVKSLLGKKIKKKSNNLYIKALNKININIKSGDRLGIYGQNGSGKSSLLRVMAGVYHPANGLIDIRGQISSFLTLSGNLRPEATGRENVIMKMILNNINPNQYDSYMKKIIKFSEIGNFFELPVSTYSSGMRARLAFSIMVEFAKDIVIMDEWLSVGDKEFKAKATLKLNEVISKSSIFIIASHSKKLINDTCNRFAHIKDGNLSLVDSLDDF